MEPWVLQLVLVASLALVGLLLVIQPMIARRGLLFGVYVGESTTVDADAARIRRTWYAGMAASFALSLACGELATWLLAVPPLGVVIALLSLSALSWVMYLVAHTSARALARPSGGASVAAITGAAQPHLAWPLAALGLAAAGGLASLAYAGLQFDRMPAVVPTHFGASGAPDAWAPRSFWSVMLAPVATLGVGGALAIVACLTARAKRAIRRADDGVSLAAQLRFRQATSVFLAGASMIVTVLLTTISWFATRTALGLSAGLPAWLPVLVGALVVYAVGGSLYLAFRLGQGGARLERPAAGAALTNGIADNTQWVLGMFYVNRDDPSIFVEKRFGLGYTINFGNPRAVVLLVLFLIVVLGIALGGGLLPQTTNPPR